MIDIYNQLNIPEKFKKVKSSIERKEAEFIYSFLKEKKIKKTLEIGFGVGCSTSYIISATCSPHFVIDPFQKERYGGFGLKNIKKLNLEKYLIFVNNFSHYALPKLIRKGVKLDFIFIDGDHKFDSIFIDFYYTDLLLNKGGYVLFHDMVWPSTQKVASWIKGNKMNYKQIKIDRMHENFIMFQKIENKNKAGNNFKEF